jgi:predicted TIM-barrel fold metal-dependent hydrolase
LFLADAADAAVALASSVIEGQACEEAADSVSIATEANNLLAAAVKENPTRIAGFAALPTALPDKAAEELERMVLEHGFKGAVINGHHRGRYLDDKFFRPLLARAASLNVPISPHPTQPPKPVIEAAYSGFSPMVNEMWLAPVGVGTLRPQFMSFGSFWVAYSMNIRTCKSSLGTLARDCRLCCSASM